MLNEIDLSRVDLNLLVLYEAVLRERHVGRAAATLNLSPSAVSHGLGRLRALLGDPLFLRTPRGVVPTERALQIGPRIADILAGIRGVIATAEPFDPARATRRFRVAAGDALLGVISDRLVAHLSASAPQIGLSFVHVTASFTGEPGPAAWDSVLAMLDSREIDAAILPTLGLPVGIAPFPARFAAHPVGEDVLVATACLGHSFLTDPTLEAYCAARHMVVSQRGDPSGAVDASLALLDRSRRVVLTVPNFTAALFVVAASDLLAALPSSLVRAHGRRLDLGFAPLPFDATPSTIRIVTARAALQDDGIAWLTRMLADTLGVLT